MFPPLIQKLIELFSKFPTVGPRTASRFVFYLTKLEKEKVKELAETILELKEKIKICPLCFNLYQGDTPLCQICQDPTRNKSLLCVVANEIDLATLEKTKKYKGLYFVLGGTLSKLKKKEIENLRIKQLEERIRKDTQIKEIILALNPTPEGEATALYLKKKLMKFERKITQLARGLPIGGELEYADEETLSAALEGRK